MNLDLLTKLVRLANNNPNDNEANLAARKVCKMIESANFQFGSKGTAPKTAAGKVRVRYENQGVWSKPPDGPRDPFFTDILHEMWKKMRDEQEKIKKESYDKETKGTWKDIKIDFEPSPKQEEFFRGGNVGGGKQERFYTGVDWDENYWSEPHKKEKEIRPLECKRCHKSVETGFVGPPQMFTCTPCQWEEYQEERDRR